eukprot:4116966-Amphidinium_carterae.1
MEQLVVVPVHQIVEEILNVPKIIPQERAMNCTVDQVANKMFLCIWFIGVLCNLAVVAVWR